MVGQTQHTCPFMPPAPRWPRLTLLLLTRVPQVLGILLCVSQKAHFRQREVKAAWVFFWAPEHIKKSPLCCSECEWGRPVNWV